MWQRNLGVVGPLTLILLQITAEFVVKEF